MHQLSKRQPQCSPVRDVYEGSKCAAGSQMFTSHFTFVLGLSSSFHLEKSINDEISDCTLNSFADTQHVADYS